MARRRTAEQMRTDRRQVSTRWFRDVRYSIAAGRLPRDPVQRLALRLARAGGRASRMGDELFLLCLGRRPSLARNGDLDRAIPRMTVEDIVNARAKLHDLTRSLEYDQRMIKGLVEALTDAERRRLTVLAGGRA